jgi:hypothetical protein
MFLQKIGTGSIADPDPGSDAFLAPGSGIRDPGSGMGKNQDPDPGSGMNIPDHIASSLATIFQVKILKFFDANANPGSGNLFDPGIWDGKIRIRDKHPGSASLGTGYKILR